MDEIPVQWDQIPVQRDPISTPGYGQVPREPRTFAYPLTGPPVELKFEDRLLRLLESNNLVLAMIADQLNGINRTLHRAFPPPPPVAVSLRLSVTDSQGETMSSFSVDTVGLTATLQFEDDKGDPTAGPAADATGSPVAPVIASDTPSVCTVGAAVASETVPGNWVAPLTLVSVGSFSVAPSPLAYQDGTPVELNGEPFPLPAPAGPFNVTAGDPTQLSISVGTTSGTDDSAPVAPPSSDSTPSEPSSTDEGAPASPASDGSAEAGSSTEPVGEGAASVTDPQ